MRCTLIAAVTAVLASRAIAQCPPGTETYHVAMHDSYGDGWSGKQYFFSLVKSLTYKPLRIFELRFGIFLWCPRVLFLQEITLISITAPAALWIELTFR